MTFMELLLLFPTEKMLVDYYVKIRYGDTPVCNHCGSMKVYQRTEHAKLYDCNDCHNTFSLFKGTIFEKSSTDMRKWMYAIHLLLNDNKDISGYQLQREIGVTYKTAWRILQQIRLTMGNRKTDAFIETIIKINKTYVDGKDRKKNEDAYNHDKNNKSGRDTKKTPTVGVIDCENKKIYSKVSPVQSIRKTIIR